MTMKKCDTEPLKSKRGRGRPKGSKNKPKGLKATSQTIVLDTDEGFTPKKKRGRPSKKKQEHDNNYYIEESDFHGNEDEDTKVESKPSWYEGEDEPNVEPDEEAQEAEDFKKKTIDVKEKKDPSPKKKHYVDTKRLEFLIEEYNETDLIPDELAIMLYDISNRMSFSPNFINYSWKDEMIGEGLVKQFTALKNKKYDPEKGRAFSYFSMIVFHAFCNKIKKENKHHEVLKDYQSEQYSSLVFEGSTGNQTVDGDDYD